MSTEMSIDRSEQPAQPGPAAYFTGTVHVAQLFSPAAPARTSAGRVTFEPGARSNWHTHPLGQTLIVVSGVGRVQRWGGPVEEIRAGDVIWTPPGVKHWHGAAPDSSMTHVAIQEVQDGKAVEWLERVTDEQFRAPPSRANGALRRAAPALAQYAEERLDGEVWKRPGLSARDRSLVTISALIARNQGAALPAFLERALDDGVKPSEISEVITHLAFYSGFGNALGAASAAAEVFARRGISADQLPSATVDHLRLDEAAEAKRAAGVEANFGAVAPGVVAYTTDLLFRDLWLRPGLAPRDRSLVTVSALVASGQVAQVTYHLGRAMDAGLTRAEASEALMQLAFYAGWPNVFSALPVFKEVFEKRAR